MRLILHIGTEKTGTTSVQSFLYKNRDVLLKQGIGLLDSIDSPNNRKLYAYCLPEEEFDDYFWDLNIRDVAAKKKYFENFLQQVSQEISMLGNKVDTVIISSEHFHSRLKNLHSIEKLKNILDPFFENFQIVCYFREQSAVIKSLYSTSMKNGHTQTLDEFTSKCLKNDHYFNYYNLLHKWADVFGKASITARIFSRKSLLEGDICRDFMNIVDADLQIDEYDFSAEAENTSLGTVGLFLARWNNRFNPRYLHNGRLNLLSKVMIKLIEKLPFSYLGKLEFQRESEVKDFYRETNTRFAQEYLGNAEYPF